jgi:hypothetical protein
LAEVTFTECAVAAPVPATGTAPVTAGRTAAFTGGGLAARVPAAISNPAMMAAR